STSSTAESRPLSTPPPADARSAIASTGASIPAANELLSDAVGEPPIVPPAPTVAPAPPFVVHDEDAERRARVMAAVSAAVPAPEREGFVVANLLTATPDTLMA